MARSVRTRRWWPLFLVALGVGLVSGASAEAAGGILFGEPWHWAEMALRLVLVTFLLPPTWRLVWVAIDREWVPQHPARRDRDRAAEIVAPVLRSGVLPDDVDRRAWRRAMRDTKQELEGMLWCWVAVNLVVAALTAAAAILANDNAWTVWAVAAVVAAQGAVAVRLTGPRLRTARRLLTELSDSDAPRRP